MSQASRWRDGVAVGLRLLGFSAEEVAGALPEGTPPPGWIDASVRQSSKEARAAILAAEVVRVRDAVEMARPRWR